MCIAVLNKTILEKALPMERFIFTAETHVIDLALDIISEQTQEFYHIPRLTLSYYY